ncbi:hypothetical protein C8J57DRAFT_1219230 [Mycena rebaudengoi]|nr:hypothetical protein C8J57DRAFT_1219230 [Mycena rebaudengoi]
MYNNSKLLFLCDSTHESCSTVERRTYLLFLAGFSSWQDRFWKHFTKGLSPAFSAKSTPPLASWEGGSAGSNGILQRHDFGTQKNYLAGFAPPPSHEAKGGVDLAENAGDSPLHFTHDATADRFWKDRFWKHFTHNATNAVPISILVHWQACSGLRGGSDSRVHSPPPEMSSMNEASLSFVSSILPNNNTIVGASILTIVAALVTHHISPMRLTRLLVTLMHETDAIHIHAVESGLIPCDVDMVDALSKLQIKVSELHEESLRNSLSSLKMLADFFRGRSLVLYRCIRDVQDLKTRIEVYPLNSQSAWQLTALTMHLDFERRTVAKLQSNWCRDGSMDHVCPKAAHPSSRLPLPLQMQLV